MSNKRSFGGEKEMRLGEDQSEKLQQVFQTIPDDLAANREGKLSMHQVELEKIRRSNFQATTRKAVAWTPIVPIFFFWC